jgi:hypothetical protein
MSERNGTGEENTAAKGTILGVLNAVVSRGPALLLVLGVLLVLIAAIGKWPERFEIDPAWRIFVAVLGGILMSFGVWRSGRSPDRSEVLPDPMQTASYGVTITYPVADKPIPVETRKSDKKKTYFEVTGTVKKLPRDAQIWVFVVGNDGRLWPHGPAHITGKDWIVHEVSPGWGESRKKIAAYLVGKNGQILIKYYGTTGREIWPIRDKINEQYPNNKIEIKVPAITETTSDMVMCNDLIVTLINND